MKKQADPAQKPSGQPGPMASGNGKFRQDSAQASPSGRLADESGRRQQKSKYRMERTGEKLDAARGKLAAQKPQKPPGPVRATGRALRGEAWGWMHEKIHQVENENAGVEAAHRSELTGESAGRSAKRFVKKRWNTRRSRQVVKLEARDVRAKADYGTRKLVQENPALKSNPLSRMAQKRRIKKQYAKKARQAAKQSARAAKQTAATTGRITRAVVGFVARHPIATLLVAAVLLLVAIVSSCVSSALSVGNGLLGAAGAATYQASDAAMTEAERRYRQWETELLLEAQNAADNHPGYDEYRYEIDNVYHDPHALMAYLTTKYGAFTFADIEADLRALFEQQYSLEFREIVETRWRTEYVRMVDPITRKVTYEARQVPYDWRVLLTKLTSRPFAEVVGPLLTGGGELERFELYYDLKGGRQYIASPFPFDWQPYISCHFGYRIHPISGEQDYHTGLDIALPTGTPILAGGAGVVLQAGWHDSYGYNLLVEYADGVTARYAHCSALNVSAGWTVAEGEVIARVGSTGDSTGPHLHLEIRKGGQLLDPIYFTGIPIGG